MLLGLAVAVLAMAVGGALEVLELVLPWLPLLVIGALLVSRRFVGESRILARLARRSRPRRAAPQQRWSRLRERALTSLHTLATQHLRGPPAPLTA
jgi:hypothetical protein